jgi:hypothetical protein
MGEDKISVDAKEHLFVHDQQGGSTRYPWSTTVTLGLDPFRLVAEEESSSCFDEQATSQTSWSWNWDDFSGTHAETIPDCYEQQRQQAEQKPPPDAGADDSEESPAVLSVASLVFPRVALPADFVADGWRSTGLGRCAALVDGREHGFTIHGDKGQATDTSMRVVLSKENTLFIEISDDRWVGPGKHWIKDDHVELWLMPSDKPVAGKKGSNRPVPNPARQWGIRIADGAVFPAFGAPAPLIGVEVVRTRRTARVKIPLPEAGSEAPGPLTVVYSDSDDGVRQKRLIATSQLEYGNADTLGEVRDIQPEEATCTVQRGSLQVVMGEPQRKVER